jgi:hypothetical protein
VSKSKVASELVELIGGAQATPVKTKREPKTPAGAGAETSTEEGRNPARKKRVCNFKRHAKNEISGAFPEIVHTLIEEAKGGSVNHTRLLFDLGGVKDQVKEDLKHKDKDLPPSFVEVLLHALVDQMHVEPTHEPHDPTPDNQPETLVADPEATLSSR